MSILCADAFPNIREVLLIVALLEFDKLYKVRPLLDRIRAYSQDAYQPLQKVAVDEAMV